jgi:hypothetical protein
VVVAKTDEEKTEIKFGKEEINFSLFVDDVNI